MRHLTIFCVSLVILFLSGCATSKNPNQTKNPSYEGEIPAVYVQVKSLPDGEFHRTEEYVLEKEKDCLYVRYLVPYVLPEGMVCILYAPPDYSSLAEFFTELLEGNAALDYRNYEAIQNTETRYFLADLQDLLVSGSFEYEAFYLHSGYAVQRFWNGDYSEGVSAEIRDNDTPCDPDGEYEQFFTVADGQTFVERKETDAAETYVLQDLERGRVERTRFRFSQGDYSYYVMDSVFEKSGTYQEAATREVYLAYGESCVQLQGTPESLTEEMIRSFVFLWSCDF